MLSDDEVQYHGSIRSREKVGCTATCAPLCQSGPSKLLLVLLVVSPAFFIPPLHGDGAFQPVQNGSTHRPSLSMGIK